uniref:Uncharacterized protein n=1 Tax=Oryza glumipatula TaxID=40148 RepID=A0A0E0A414_9ORYZ
MVHRDSVYRLPRRRLELLRIRKAAVGVVVGVGGTGAPSREHIGVTQGGADLEDVVVDVVAAASSSSGSCCFVVHGQLLAVVDADAGDGEKQLGVLIWRDREGIIWIEGFGEEEVTAGANHAVKLPSI